jgi:ankyrin repeat protein
MEMAALLCTAGADVEAPSPAGLTLLHSAIMRGDTPSAIFLLRQKASPSTLTADGRTPLQLAITHGAEGVVCCRLCSRF